MAEKTINVLITSFAGLGLPPTWCLPTPSTTSVQDVTEEIARRVPSNVESFILTTSSNKEVVASEKHIGSLVSSQNDILSLRLSVPLCGGKGGFGSQLRAAGGRMSSKRKKDQGVANSSNRNLDGRRLRTINEAKALAEYLALKPEMEKKEKEARRKRWEQVVELAERREEEIKSGSKGRVDGKWVEDKEEAGERVRDAARAAVLSGHYRDNFMNRSDKSSSDDEDEEMMEQEAEKSGQSDSSEAAPAKSVPAVKKIAPAPRAFNGFDEDDEFMSDSEESEVSGNEGKGKGKA